jgi:DNA repair protein RadC
MEIRFKTRTFQVRHAPGISLGTVEGPQDVVPLLRAIFRDACDADREHFVVLAVNARGKVLGYKVIASGTLASCLVHPRDVFAVAIAFRAASLVVSHSHPSQDPDPSEEDYELTRRLTDAGRLLGIPVLDHIVLASSGAADAPWRSAMQASNRSHTRAASTVREA